MSDAGRSRRTISGQQDTWLESVLDGFTEGVIICEQDGKILFQNTAAGNLLEDDDATGPGSSLYGFLPQKSVEQALGSLKHVGKHAENGSAGIRGNHFVFTTMKEGRLLHCRMALVPSESNRPGAFVLIFDLEHDRDYMPKADCHLLCSKVEELRSPLANLRAAAENLVTHPEMAPVMRRAFEKVIAQESILLTERFEELAEGSRTLALEQSSFVEMYSADLFENLKKRLSEKAGPQLIAVEDHQWLKVDAYSLLLVLEFFACQLKELYLVDTITFQTQTGDKSVYIDYIWKGKPVPSSEIEMWRQHQIMVGSVAGQTIASILESHNSDVWSQHHQDKGLAMVRIPVPVSGAV